MRIVNDCNGSVFKPGPRGWPSIGHGSGYKDDKICATEGAGQIAFCRPSCFIVSVFSTENFQIAMIYPMFIQARKEELPPAIPALAQ